MAMPKSLPPTNSIGRRTPSSQELGSVHLGPDSGRPTDKGILGGAWFPGLPELSKRSVDGFMPSVARLR